MPRLDYSIIGPQAGAIVGRSIAVSGVDRVLPAASGKLLIINVSGVQVEFGAGGPVLDAQRSNGGWSCTGSLLPSVHGGTQVILTAVLRGTNQFDVGKAGNPEAGPEVPFEERRPVSVQVAVAPPPVFTVTAPVDGAVVELHEGGGEVDVALTIPGEQFFPLTISVSEDGHTTSEQFTGTQYQRRVALAPLPLGPRSISVSVANLNSVGPAQTRTVTGRDVTPPRLQVDSPQVITNNTIAIKDQNMSKIRFRPNKYALALAISALIAGSGFMSVSPASASTTAYTPIKNAAPRQLCLDVRSEDGLQNEGARLQIYHCTGVSEQKFRLVPADSGQGPIPGLYEIRPRSSSGKCLVANADRSAFTGQPVPDGEGAQVDQEECYPFRKTQNWYLKNTNEIVNQSYQTCLDTTGSGSHDHELVMIWPCNGNLTQRWIW